MEPTTQNNLKANLGVPIAIVVAGIFIGAAIFFGGRVEREEPLPTNNKAPETSLNLVRPISEDDHIRGNPNAKIVIVEYSDTECPFCARFHETMKRIMNEYGKSGQVAWVYRHYPLDQLHPRARQEAVALECINELGGADKFWLATDSLYGQKNVSSIPFQIDLNKLATDQGISQANFSACMSSGRYDAKIQADLENAIATGGNGTPWSVIITSAGQLGSLNGAYPYENVKQIIDSLLAN